MTSRNKILTAAIFLLFGASLLSLSGCKKTPSCELLYKRLDKCIDDFGLKKDKFVKRCNKKKDKAIVKAQIACSKFASCDKFKKCIEDSGKKVRAQRLKDEIEKNLKEGKIKEALLTCKYSKKSLTDDLKKKCADLQAKQWATLKAKAVKVRDSGGKDDWTTCNGLKSVSEALGDEAKQKEAQALCAEMAVGKNVAKALANAKVQATKPKPSIPFECSWALNSIKSQKVQTPWMKKQRTAVVENCYKKLGKSILEKWLAAKPRWCSFNATKLYRSVKKYGISDPAIKGLLEKAAKFCKKEFEKADADLAKAPSRKSGAARKPAAGMKPDARK